jgi:hypothetical protein
MSIEPGGQRRVSGPRRATVFISHASRDEALVGWLAAQVEATGHAAWVAEWNPEPGESLTKKVQSALADCDAFIFLLTEAGYRSIYVAHEVGAAKASGKPLIALVDRRLEGEPLGMLTDVEQVRFDPDDLASSTAAITAGLTRLGESRAAAESFPVAAATDAGLVTMSLQVNVQFQLTQEQVLVGVLALAAIAGLFYLASIEAGA